MKLSLLCLIAIGYSFGVLAQKPIIDTSVFGKWPGLGEARISNDGKYLAYPVKNVPVGHSSLVIRAIGDNWEARIPGILDYSFTANNRHATLVVAGDSLILLNLHTRSMQYLTHISAYTLLSGLKGEWLAYRVNEPDRAGDLYLRNLSTDEQQTLLGVSDYLFNEKKSLLVLKKHGINENGKDRSSALFIFDLITREERTVWEGENLITYRLDNAGVQLAFLAGKETNISVWYCKLDGNKPKVIVNDSILYRYKGLMLNSSGISFSDDGTKLFFTLSEPSLPTSGGVAVDIWSYTDKYLQEDQLRRERGPNEFVACVDLENKKIIRLQEDGDVFTDGNHPNGHNNYAILTKNYGPDFWWQKSARASAWLFDIRNDTRKLLKENLGYAVGLGKLGFQLSPSENYVVYYDPEKHNYFCYEIATGKTINITAGIATSWADETFNGWSDPAFKFPVGIGGWLEDEQAVLIYDNCDIWRVDPKGRERPINITNEYGRRYKLRFRLLLGPEENRKISVSSNLILKTFDLRTKNSGFYSKQLGKTGEPVFLSSGPYLYEFVLRSRDANTWILSRESATEFPNYYITEDFRTFRSISDLKPQKKFNWLTAELISWPMADGRKSKGILYKPENFDPKKKHPIIFQYYELQSDGLNKYLEPYVTHDDINIPYFVSQGYLVFIPDIHYVIGEPGKSAVDAVVSAAKFLAQKPWVDGRHMGIQGHSFGGYETNFIITHSHLFAAAAEGAGDCDFVSGYGALFVGESRQWEYENYQFRIWASLWQRPDLYVRNSPIFKADQVTTPLLMMHNKNDPSVPWAQGVEFFTALRRLGKKVWMLQYDQGTHDVSPDGSLDFTIRVNQFFNHYLKDAPPPKWMTGGVPAHQKGIERGYGLDTSGKVP